MYAFYIKDDFPFLFEENENVQFSETPSTEKFEMQEPINRWGFVIDGYTNDSLPYLQLLTPPVQFFEYVQGSYITVHDIATNQNDFNNNGLAILEPIRTVITEELDGIYDLEMEYHIDNLGK